MERATSQREAVKALLQEFQQTRDTQKLLDGLRQLEAETADGELWIRFFDGDTGATTIRDLERHLAAPSHPNYTSVLESIAIALEQDGLQLYFS
ncbi:hypothetical protein [Pontibacter litorisediminis]|uniref:hypothetical protein n=1 Tax=Pontibacter litorisediminis TaxID=1846260 RepID=UPI0023EBDC8D|nr:hypothetical protein [Pontibacter litorisediminis]